MKKTMLVVAIAALLIVAMAGTAFATQQSLSSPYMGASSTGQGNMAFVYVSWGAVEGVGGNPPSTSPHGNYGTTTEKCAVCHAVHVAAPSNAAITSNMVGTNAQDADTLLRMRAEDACLYCHMSGVNSVSSPVASWTPGSPHGTNNCDECHTGPHGAGMDPAPSLSGLILKAQPSTGYVTTGVAQTAGRIDAYAGNAWAGGGVTGYTEAQYNTLATSAVRDQAVGVFCAECHESAFAVVKSGAIANANGYNAGTKTAYTSHRTQAAISTDWGSATNIHSSAVSDAGMQIAWAPASSCASCHDADNGYGGQAFPHGLGPSGAERWLMSAAFAGDTEAASTNALQDGVCLKCHRGNSTSSGVGLSF